MSTTKKEVLDKLSQFFNKNESGLLEMFDTPSDTAKKRGGYTGVTIGYLRNYVVPDIDTSLIIESINELIQTNIISKLRCNNINRTVFEKYKTSFERHRGLWSQELISYNEVLNSKIFSIDIEEYVKDDEEE